VFLQEALRLAGIQPVAQFDVLSGLLYGMFS